jgi:hypothetical protein
MRTEEFIPGHSAHSRKKFTTSGKDFIFPVMMIVSEQQLC